MNRRVGGLTEFAFERLTYGRSLNITIAVTGWLSEDNYGSTYTHLFELARYKLKGTMYHSVSVIIFCIYYAAIL